MTEKQNPLSDKFNIFSALNAELIDATRLDHLLNENEQQQDPRIIALFLWGNDCYNCDQAKGAMRQVLDRLLSFNIRWLHANVYEQPDIAHRFSLHGVPAFLFFHHGKKLGRITAYPGNDKFIDTLEALIKEHP